MYNSKYYLIIIAALVLSVLTGCDGRTISTGQVEITVNAEGSYVFADLWVSEKARLQYTIAHTEDLEERNRAAEKFRTMELMEARALNAIADIAGIDPSEEPVAETHPIPEVEGTSDVLKQLREGQ